MACEIGPENIDDFLTQRVLHFAGLLDVTPETERRSALIGDFADGGKIRQWAGLVEPLQMKPFDRGSQAAGITRRERDGAAQHEIRITGHGAQLIKAAADGFGECLPLVARRHWRQWHGESAEAG